MSESESSRKNLLVVEDEAHLAAGLKLNLELEGFAVDVAETARDAARLMVEPGAYDVIVLDVMLPDIDGFSLCRKLRDSGNYTPVLMLTVRNSAEDRVTGLESGADDYLVKPFEFNELLARVRSLVRRERWAQARATSEHATGAVLEFGNARVDFDRHEVEVDGESVTLTRLELDLLRYMSQHESRVLSRDELLAEVWNLRNYPNTRTVDNFIMRLRKHFEPNSRRPVHFISVRGAGYKFVLVPEDEE